FPAGRGHLGSGAAPGDDGDRRAGAERRAGGARCRAGGGTHRRRARQPWRRGGPGRRADGPTPPRAASSMMTALEGRRRAREAAFQVAFQADLMSESFAETWSRLKEDFHLSGDQCELVEDVVATLERQREDVDGALRSAAEHWEIERLGGPAP